MTPSLEGWPTKAKEAPSPDEVRLAPLDTNPVFQSLGVCSKLKVTKNNFNLQEWHQHKKLQMFMPANLYCL